MLRPTVLYEKKNDKKLKILHAKFKIALEPGSRILHVFKVPYPP